MATIIGTAGPDKYITIFKGTELMRVIGKDGTPLPEQFTVGKQIAIESVWEQLALLKDKADFLTSLANNLESVAAKVRQLAEGVNQT